ncbi:MAG: hypothetical protein QW315_00790 [Candidatus Hadarchaeum sp.]
MTLQVDEDLISTLFTTMLLLMLTTAMINSYQNYSEKRQEIEDFELALNTAETLISKVLATPENSPGLIAVLPERLENFSKILSSRGVEIQVEIRSLTGELLYPKKHQSQGLNGNFKLNVSIPVALYCDNESVQLCEMVVHFRRE